MTLQISPFSACPALQGQLGSALQGSTVSPGKLSVIFFHFIDFFSCAWFRKVLSPGLMLLRSLVACSIMLASTFLMRALVICASNVEYFWFSIALTRARC